MNIELQIDDLSDGRVVELLDLHFREMHNYSPPESIHALNADKFKDPKITFWSARVDGEVIGCGALKQILEDCGEIKSMKTRPEFLGKGIASKILDEIIGEARRRSYTDLMLETGSNAAFEPAIALYNKFGFVECDPFDDYRLDPYSRFFTKTL